MQLQKEVETMRVINRINNNVVLVKDGRQKMIVTGKGLGFKVYPGDEIREQAIEQRFVLQEDKDEEYYIKMLKKLPLELIGVCEKIVCKSRELLGKQLSDTLVFTLADHVNFTMERMEKNMLIDHPLANEIKQFYPKELEAGKYALALMKEELQIALPAGEAVFITMHIVNASGGLSDTYDVGELTEMMVNIVAFIETYFECEIDQDSSAFSRFITHLRYYLIRQLNFELDDSINEELLEIVKEKYPKAYACAEQIAHQLEENYHSETVDSEKLYLTLHINRLLMKN